jgi:hypothetical protein
VVAQRREPLNDAPSGDQVIGGVDAGVAGGADVGVVAPGAGGAGAVVVVVGTGGSVAGAPGTVVGGLAKKSIAGLFAVVVGLSGAAGRLLAHAPRPTTATAPAAATRVRYLLDGRAFGSRRDRSMTCGW